MTLELLRHEHPAAYRQLTRLIGAQPVSRIDVARVRDDAGLFLRFTAHKLGSRCAAQLVVRETRRGGW